MNAPIKMPTKSAKTSKAYTEVTEYLYALAAKNLTLLSEERLRYPVRTLQFAQQGRSCQGRPLLTGGILRVWGSLGAHTQENKLGSIF